MRPESDLLPEIGEEAPVVGRDARPSKAVDREAGRQNGDDARDMENTLGDNKNEIGERNRQRALGEAVVARPGNDLQKGAADKGSEHGAADERDDEFERRACDDGRVSGGDDASSTE